METPTAIPTFAPVEWPLSEEVAYLGKPVEVVAVMALVLEELVCEVSEEPEEEASATCRIENFPDRARILRVGLLESERIIR